MGLIIHGVPRYEYVTPLKGQDLRCPQLLCGEARCAPEICMEENWALSCSSRAGCFRIAQKVKGRFIRSSCLNWNHRGCALEPPDLHRQVQDIACRPALCFAALVDTQAANLQYRHQQPHILGLQLRAPGDENSATNFFGQIAGLVSGMNLPNSRQVESRPDRVFLGKLARNL